MIHEKVGSKQAPELNFFTSDVDYYAPFIFDGAPKHCVAQKYGESISDS